MGKQISSPSLAFLDDRFVNVTGDTMTGELEIEGFGLKVSPGSDIDADLVSVNVTGNPVLKWDESESSFSINAGMRVVGQEDIVQQVLIRNATQTADIAQIRDSDGITILGGVDERGILFSHGGTDDTNFFGGRDSGNIVGGGTDNLCIGFNTGRKITGGTNNLFYGSHSGEDCTTGFSCVGMGSFSLANVTKGHDLVAVGGSSLAAITTQDDSVAIGSQAGWKYIAEAGLFLGHKAGLNQTTGDFLFVIDTIGRASIAEEITNSILFGQIAAAPADQTLRINAKLGVSVTPITQLHVAGAITFEELSSDPTDPLEGDAVLWMGDGTGTGDDGGLLYMEQSGGVVETGSLKWKDFVPGSIMVNTSDGTTGSVTDVQTMFDGNDYVIDEATGVPGFDVEFNFTNVDRCPTFVVARWKYNGSKTHFCTIDIYNYNTTSWDELRVFVDSDAYYSSMTMYIPQANAGDYVDGSGNAMVRFYHHTTGNAAHDLEIDYVGLTHSLQGVI